MTDSRNYLMVAAIDFGTTYSGYSFSLRDEFLKNPLQIHTATWKTTCRLSTGEKTPTCLLLNKKREFVAFGYDAEDRWTDLILDKEQDDYYYFQRFKMNLHNNKVKPFQYKVVVNLFTDVSQFYQSNTSEVKGYILIITVLF